MRVVFQSVQSRTYYQHCYILVSSAESGMYRYDGNWCIEPKMGLSGTGFTVYRVQVYNPTDQYNITPPTIASIHSAICFALITIPAAFIPLPKSFVPTCNTIPSTFFPSFLTFPIWPSTNLAISLIFAPDSPHTFTSSAWTIACNPSLTSFARKILSPTTIHTAPFLSSVLTLSLLASPWYPWSPSPSNSCSLFTPDPSQSSLISSSLTSPSLNLDSTLYALSNLALFSPPTVTSFRSFNPCALRFKPMSVIAPSIPFPFPPPCTPNPLVPGCGSLSLSPFITSLSLSTSTSTSTSLSLSTITEPSLSTTPKPLSEPMLEYRSVDFICGDYDHMFPLGAGGGGGLKSTFRPELWKIGV